MVPPDWVSKKVKVLLYDESNSFALLVLHFMNS
jgi:hypothetical protein